MTASVAALSPPKTFSYKSSTPFAPPSLTLVHNATFWHCLSLFDSGGITFHFWKWTIVPFPSASSFSLRRPWPFILGIIGDSLLQYYIASANSRNLSCRNEQWGTMEGVLIAFRPIVRMPIVRSRRCPTKANSLRFRPPSFHNIHTPIGLEPNLSVSVIPSLFPTLLSCLVTVPLLPHRASTDNAQIILYRVHAPACSASWMAGAGVFWS